MTRTGWAERKVEKAYKSWDSRDCDNQELSANLLAAEHARAVRIVKQYAKRYGTKGSPCELICNDLIAALTQGRT